MKNTITYLVGLIFLILQGCCYGESTLSHSGTTHVNCSIIMLDKLDTIYKISYPNSSLVLNPNSNISNLFLSEATDNTQIFIQSNVGFDTIIINSKKTVSYSPSSACDEEYIKQVVFDPNVIYHTFDSCYFIIEKDNNFYSNREEKLYIK